MWRLHNRALTLLPGCLAMPKRNLSHTCAGYVQYLQQIENLKDDTPSYLIEDKVLSLLRGKDGQRTRLVLYPRLSLHFSPIFMASYRS